MKIQKVISFVVVSLVLFCCSCGGGGSGGTPGNPLAAYKTVPLAAGEGGCDYGGVRIDMGVDDNRNGLLDLAEVDATDYVCNGDPGANGQTALIRVDEVAWTTECAFGGQKVMAGLDDDASGTLEELEVDSTQYVCNGSPDYFPPSPEPVALALGVQTDGTLAPSDFHTPDGKRVDFLQFAMPERGLLRFTKTSGVYDLYVFTADCLNTAGLSAWGPYLVPEETLDRALDAGNYVVLVQATAPINSWETKPYGIKALFSNVGMTDIAFGTGGYASLSSGTGQINALAVQADGKILGAGTANLNISPKIGVCRFNADGTVDTGFGVNGFVQIDLAGYTYQYGYAVALQQVGEEQRILVGGQAHSGGATMFALVRLTPDGALDETFGSGGIVVMPTSFVSGGIRALGLQSDGKIVAAGGNGVFLAARFNADGSLDESFGASGKATLTLPGKQAPYVYGMAVLPDDRILLAGYSFDNSWTQHVTVGQLEAGGAPDASFGTGGAGDYVAGAYANVLTRLSDGKFLVGTNYGKIVRYNADGTLDTGFGTGGVTALGSNLVVGILPQADGGLLAFLQDSRLAYAGSSGFGGVLVRRLDSAGVLDASYGFGGYTFTTLAYGISPTSSAMQPDRKMLIGVLANGPFGVLRYE